jgi:membrane-associated phospholipid phosphatase
MHHPTDVLAAFLNGLACVTIASIFVLNRRGWGDPADPPGAPALESAGAG